MIDGIFKMAVKMYDLKRLPQRDAIAIIKKLIEQYQDLIFDYIKKNY